MLIDKLISEHCGLAELVDENYAIVNSFSINNVPLHRVNADKVVNTYGTQMIEFCKAKDLFILNGGSGIMYKTPNLPVRIEAILTTVLVHCML